MEAAELAALRMRNQRLWRAEGDTQESPSKILGRFGAMQAQEFMPAMWAIAQRTNGLDRDAVASAYADGQILRTHILRPTWHFVHPGSIGWLIEATASRVHAINAPYYRRTGLEDPEFERIADLVKSELADGRQLTRKQIATVLESNGIEATGMRMALILMQAELESVIISGAPVGKQQTYASFADRVPAQPAIGRTEALGRLAGNYFTMRGPATVKDLARWASLTIADARIGLEQVSADLDVIEVGSRTYWTPRASPPAQTMHTPVVDLVQSYDEVVMSYSESKDVLRPRWLQPLADAPFIHAILLDGQLVGHWKHTQQRADAIIDTFFYRELGSDEKAAMDAAVDRFGGFLGLDATWR